MSKIMDTYLTACQVWVQDNSRYANYTCSYEDLCLRVPHR